MNRHARYRPATTTRNHCHAAVVSLGGCFVRKGQLNRHTRYRPATTCTTQNTASHRTLEKMSAACTPFSLTFDRRHCHDQHVRIYRGGGLLRCARAASALSVRWPSERRPKTALSGPLRGGKYRGQKACDSVCSEQAALWACEHVRRRILEAAAAGHIYGAVR